MELLIGADPELFVRDKDGQPVSGHIFRCGTKKNPLRTKNGSVQVDGIALEFNVRPSRAKMEFIENVQNVLDDLEGLVRQRLPDGTLDASPTIYLSEAFLQKLPQKNSELGCNPDYDAYTQRANHPPDASQTFRTGAGHVHFGWGRRMDISDWNHFQSCAQLARQMDYYLGLPSLKWDNDAQRRKLYGNAGAFRPKKYGMEYRVLSNAWLRKKEITGLIFDQAKKGFDRIVSGWDMYERFGDFAREMINGNNPDWDILCPDIAEIIYA